MSLKKIFLLLIFLILTKEIFAQEIKNEEKDLINEKINNSYIKSEEYNIEELSKDFINKEIYTNEDFLEDKKIIDKVMSTNKMENYKKEIIYNIFKEYKNQIIIQKEAELKALPIFLSKLEEKLNQISKKYILKEKINKDNYYEITSGVNYFIEWDTKTLIEYNSIESENILQTEKDKLFTINYNALHDYILITWPKKAQEEENKIYPIIVKIKNMYGMYFEELELETNKQISIIEEGDTPNSYVQ